MIATSDTAGLLPAFCSTRSRAQAVGAALVLAAAVGWAAAGYDVAELRTFAAIRAGGSLEAADRSALTRVGWLVGAAQLATAAGVAAVFLPWLYQARANLRALGVRRLRFGREWAYLAFAVPLINAYRPCQIVSEVWRGSDPTSGDPLAWQQIRAPRLVIAWWIALAAWVGLEIAASLLGMGAGRAPIQLALASSLTADICAGVSATLGYFVVTRISEAQDAKWRAFGGGDLAELRKRSESAHFAPETASA